MIDRTGQRMGRMEVLSFSHKTTSSNSCWHVKCVECGWETTSEWKSKPKGHGCKSCHGRDQQRTLKYRKGRGKDLYMFRQGPFVKIGVSDDVEMRLKAIQAANPLPVELVGHWPGEGHREQHWHEELKHLHERGEWYSLGGY